MATKTVHRKSKESGMRQKARSTGMAVVVKPAAPRDGFVTYSPVDEFRPETKVRNYYQSKSVEPEVEEFRKGFDLNKIARDLGHTPGAMVGQLLDAVTSKAAGESKGPNRESNGAKSETKKAKRETTAFQLGEQAIDIPTGRIRPFAFQVRTYFDQAALEQLGAGIKKHGQLQEALVRPPVDGVYELIAGERRLRACKLAGVITLRARVLDVTDEEAIQIHGDENFDQESLNPIEKARQLRNLKDRCGYTQEALANKFKQAAEGGKKGTKKASGPRSQGAVSNLLRLLELPEVLQAKVASGALPISHATVLVPYGRVKSAADAFAKAMEKPGFELQPLEYFDDQLEDVFFADADFVGKSDKEEWALLEKHRDELDVVEELHGVLVFNQKRWSELTGALRKQKAAKADKRDASEAKKAKAEEVKLSPAEVKRRASANAKKHRNRVERWYTAWLQRQIAERLGLYGNQYHVIGPVEIKLLLLFCTVDHRQRPQKDIREALKSLSLTAKRHDQWMHEGWSLLSPVDLPNAASAAAIATLKLWVAKDTEANYAHLRPADVRAISREMAVDVGKHWTLDESFLQLFSKQQLRGLANEWGYFGGKNAKPAEHVPALLEFEALKRSEAIRDLLDWAKDRRLPTPAILLAVSKAK
jgi:ParB/RepB/Spo0J family partition protein